MATNNLSQGLQSYLQGMSDEQAIRTLQMEGRRLKYIATKVWRQYLGSYQPKMYVRTRDTQRGIKLGRVKKISPFEYGIELTFENELMYHDSIFDKQRGTKGNWEQGHSLMLISDGWHSRKLENRIGKIEGFTYFEGIDYLGKVKEQYEAGAPAGVRLEIQWSGNYTR